MSYSLTQFKAHLSNYWYVFRIKYNLPQTHNVGLRYLTNGDAVVVNCCVIEPLVNVTDFWFNGSTLRQCVGTEGQPLEGFDRSYRVIHNLRDAFNSTPINLNPDIKLEGVMTTTPPPSQTEIESTGQNMQAFLRKTGGEMSGPLFLSSDPQEPKQAATMAYVDRRISQSNVNLSNLIAEMAGLQSAFRVTQLGFNQISAEFSQVKPDIDQALKAGFHSHIQTEPSVSWRIEHGRNTKNLICNVYDELGDQVIPNQVKIANKDTVVIAFLAAQAGTATLFLHN